MRIVVQRVSRASVRVAGETVSEIGRGLLLLVGIERGDGPVPRSSGQPTGSRACGSSRTTRAT